MNRKKALETLERSADAIRAGLDRVEQERAVIIPRITETTHRGEREWDIYSRLLKDRIVFLGWEIDDFAANSIVAQFLFLEAEDPDKQIQMYINSPGGIVTAGLAIIDTINYIRCPVSTMCIGQASSMGAVLLAVGAQGQRFALPHARIMIHQPLGGARGQATDIEIQAREIKKVKETLIDMLSTATGQKRERIAGDIERDFYLSAVEAKEYGLIDKVLRKAGQES